MTDAVLESLIAESGAGRRRADPKPEDLSKRPPAERDAILRAQAALKAARPGERVAVDVPAIPTNSVLSSVPKPADKVLESLTREAGPIEQPKPKPQGGFPPTHMIPGMPPEGSPAYEPGKSPNLAQRILGIPETALSVGSGLAAGLVAPAAVPVVGAYKSATGPSVERTKEQELAEGNKRILEIREALTYRPRSAGAQANVEGIGGALSASKLAGIGPAEGFALSNVLAHGKNASRVSGQLQEAGVGRVGGASGEGSALGVVPTKAVPGIGISGERAAPGVGTGALGSVGAAGAGTIEQARALVAGASPEIRAAVEQAAKGKNATVNLPALTRHVEADSLPVKVPLTPGQATGDVSMLSFEKIRRGTDARIADRFNEQNKALIENTNRIRENAAPDVYVSSKPDIGNLVIEAYRAKDDALNAGISAKYQALKDANGGSFPLDAKTFVQSADKALHKGLLYDHVPNEIRRTIDRLASEGMTFENFEALRTNLARIQRSATADGNAKAAAGVIRDALEELPMPAGAEHLKPLADAARAAAKERFQMIEGDPAYKAVTRGTASADDFVEKFIVRANQRRAEAAIRNLDPTAIQAVRAGVIRQLQESAGIVNDSGNFRQHGYNKALDELRPKLGLLFDPAERQHLETLGKVSRYTTEQPAGSFVNNSNTTVAALAEMAKEGAKSGVEGAANVAAKGIPIGSFARRIMENRARARETNEILRPGGGILLRDVPR